MRRISLNQPSALTDFRFFVWAGFLVYFVVSYLLSLESLAELEWRFVAGPLGMLIVAFLVFRLLDRDLVDEVVDYGSYLAVRRGGRKQRVHLADIMNLSIARFTPNITVHLKEEGPFGKEFTFSANPKLGLNPWRRPPIYDELVDRVIKARGN